MIGNSKSNLDQQSKNDGTKYISLNNESEY